MFLSLFYSVFIIGKNWPRLANWPQLLLFIKFLHSCHSMAAVCSPKAITIILIFVVGKNWP